MNDPSDKSANKSHVQAIQELYRNRDSSALKEIYNPLRAVNVRIAAERQRILTELLRNWLGSDQLREKKILEIGCGAGGNLLNFISLGANPAHLTGNDLVPHRIEEARARLPAAVRLHCGDAGELKIDAETFDIVLQSVCFSSILDDAVLRAVANRAWFLLRPGGAFLSYDFTVNNPRNPNVRGISVARLRELFPHGAITARRVTLAPPIARSVWSGFYPSLNAFPFLRTHAWCLIPKPVETARQPADQVIAHSNTFSRK